MFLTDSQPGYVLSMFLKFCLISAWTFLKEKECLFPKQQLYSDLIHLSRKSVVEFWAKQLIFSWFWYVSHCLINRAPLFKAKSSAYWRSIEEKNLSQTVSLNLAAKVFFSTSFNRKLASWKENRRKVRGPIFYHRAK